MRKVLDYFAIFKLADKDWYWQTFVVLFTWLSCMDCWGTMLVSQYHVLTLAWCTHADVSVSLCTVTNGGLHPFLRYSAIVLLLSFDKAKTWLCITTRRRGGFHIQCFLLFLDFDSSELWGCPSCWQGSKNGHRDLFMWSHLSMVTFRWYLQPQEQRGTCYAGRSKTIPCKIASYMGSEIVRLPYFKGRRK